MPVKFLNRFYLPDGQNVQPGFKIQEIQMWLLFLKWIKTGIKTGRC
jgi:hypothetical protein